MAKKKRVGDYKRGEKFVTPAGVPCKVTKNTGDKIDIWISVTQKDDDVPASYSDAFLKKKAKEQAAGSAKLQDIKITRRKGGPTTVEWTIAGSETWKGKDLDLMAEPA